MTVTEIHAPSPAASRRKLPHKRAGMTFSFTVGGCEGYVTVGEFGDGTPGEVFMKVSKQGSTLAGVMDAFSIAISIGLQYGVPLETFVKKYTNMRFEPAGITDDSEVRLASSLVDYVFRRLALEYLSPAERADLGVFSVSERSEVPLPGMDDAVAEIAAADEQVGFGDRSMAGPRTSLLVSDPSAPWCYTCGVIMQRAGSCHVCPSCGMTSGCS
ncbi:MAG: TSCPD domain-containing protein [Acidimicrobiales bacterium]